MSSSPQRITEGPELSASFDDEDKQVGNREEAPPGPQNLYLSPALTTEDLDAEDLDAPLPDDHQNRESWQERQKTSLGIQSTSPPSLRRTTEGPFAFRPKEKQKDLSLTSKESSITPSRLTETTVSLADSENEEKEKILPLHNAPPKHLGALVPSTKMISRNGNIPVSQAILPFRTSGSTRESSNEILLRWGSSAQTSGLGHVTQSLPTECFVRDRGHHLGEDTTALVTTPQESRWVVIPMEQAQKAVEELMEQARQNTAYASEVQRYKRERILIYDASMKQAEKKKEVEVAEAKDLLRHERDGMRRETDEQLRKMEQLYEDRKRDFAEMLTQKRDEEISKSAAELRQDWARQKKTISQLVNEIRSDEKGSMAFAMALHEQAAEEHRAELENLTANVYGQLKIEFERREQALREQLHDDHQRDMEGQLLLAQLRHEKEIEQLRVELSQGASTRSSQTESSASDSSKSATGPEKRCFRSPMRSGMSARKSVNKTAASLGVFKSPTSKSRSLPQAPIVRSRPTSAGTSKPSSHPGPNKKQKVSRISLGKPGMGLRGTRIPVDEHETQEGVIQERDTSITSRLAVSPTKTCQKN